MIMNELVDSQLHLFHRLEPRQMQKNFFQVFKTHCWARGHTLRYYQDMQTEAGGDPLPTADHRRPVRLFETTALELIHATIDRELTSKIVSRQATDVEK